MITEDKFTEIFCLADDFLQIFLIRIKEAAAHKGKESSEQTRKALRSRGDYYSNSIPLQMIQLSQTLLYSVYL